MPEHISGNMYQLLPGEFFTTTEGEYVEINQVQVVKVQDFPDIGCLSIEMGDRKYEVTAPLDQAVQTKH